MHPLLLAAGMHDQQVAIRQGKDFLPGWILSMEQAEVAGGPQRQGSDRLALIDLLFVIGMPTHAVLTVSVEVEQTSVEARSAGLIHEVP